MQALGNVGGLQQPDVGVVDELVFLAFAQRLDGEPDLVLNLIHRVAVQVGDAGVDPQHGLGDVQFVFARR